MSAYIERFLITNWSEFVDYIADKRAIDIHHRNDAEQIAVYEFNQLTKRNIKSEPNLKLLKFNNGDSNGS